jgi:hypothetical protein
MTDDASPPPFLLAGPIVRRVEPRLVSVWVATSEPCTVKLEVWPGMLSVGTGPGVFQQGGAVATGQRQTLRVGSGLHIAVVVAEPAQPLLPGTRYAYNVTFTGGSTRDLKTLGLLTDTEKQPALGYQNNLLPSFATCPVRIEDLVLSQNSCNRMHADGPNLFFVVDEQIEATHHDPVHRPHQLLLTGDQVYSDDVALCLSPLLNSTGRDLIGALEIVRIVVQPDDRAKFGNHAEFRVPVLDANLPTGYRSRLVEATGVASGGASHLIGLGERLAIHLYTWSPEPWDLLPKDKPDDLPRPRLPEAGPLFTDERAQLLDAFEILPHGVDAAEAGQAKRFLIEHLSCHSKEGLADKVKSTKFENEQLRRYYSNVGRVRRALANVPTYMMFDDHEVTDDWYIAADWKHTVLGNPLGRSIIRDGLLAYCLMQGWGNDPKAFDQGPGAELLDAVTRLYPTGAAEGPDATAVADIDALLGTNDQPPRMVWNYAVSGATHQVLVLDTRTRRQFSGPFTPPIALPDGIREDQIPEGPLPSGVEVLVVVVSQPVLDSVMLGEFTQGFANRTLDASVHIKRAAKHVRRVLQHVKQPPEHDFCRTPDPPEPPAYGLQEFDFEGWSTRPDEIDKLLARLATYRKVLILSGDVHHSESHQLSYWRRNEGLVSEMAQLTCSAVQYSPFFGKIAAATGLQWLDEIMGFGYPIQRLIWRDPAGDPVASPTPAHRALRRRLLFRPISVPTSGWPDGTTVEIDPDVAWRMDQLVDERSDDDRPESVQPDKLAAEFPTNGDPVHDPNGYAALAGRHAKSMRALDQTRRALFFNNVGTITFERHVADRLVVLHTLSSIHPKEGGPPAPYTVYRARFDAPQDMPWPTIPESAP